MSVLGRWRLRRGDRNAKGLTFAPLRRGEQRLPLQFEIDIVIGNERLSCHTINVSGGGVLIGKALKAPPGTLVALSLAGLPRQVQGRIRRVGAHSTAIAFLSQQAGQAFMSWLCEGAASPGPLATRIH
ncbi:MAG: PilZ domain-containing protein [Inquilinaceae bacterium]